MTRLLLPDLSPSSLLTFNHTHGLLEPEGELAVTLEQQSVGSLLLDSHQRELLRKCVYTSEWISKIYPQFLQYCLFGFRNNVCHRELPELAVDSFQVALWLLSSLRTCPDPLAPDPPKIVPAPQLKHKDGVVVKGRSNMEIRPGWVFSKSKRLIPQSPTSPILNHQWLACSLSIAVPQTKGFLVKLKLIKLHYDSFHIL